MSLAPVCDPHTSRPSAFPRDKAGCPFCDATHCPPPEDNLWAPLAERPASQRSIFGCWPINPHPAGAIVARISFNRCGLIRSCPGPSHDLRMSPVPKQLNATILHFGPYHRASLLRASLCGVMRAGNLHKARTPLFKT